MSGARILTADGNFLTGYRIDLIASETTSPNPIMIVSSSNQTFGVILPFMRHLVSGLISGRGDLYTVYNNGKNGKRHWCAGSRSPTAPMEAGWAGIRMDSPNKEMAPHLEKPPPLANRGRYGKACIVNYLYGLVFLALSLKEH